MRKGNSRRSFTSRSSSRTWRFSSNKLDRASKRRRNMRSVICRIRSWVCRSWFRLKFGEWIRFGQKVDLPFLHFFTGTISSSVICAGCSGIDQGSVMWIHKKWGMYDGLFVVYWNYQIEGQSFGVNSNLCLWENSADVIVGFRHRFWCCDAVKNSSEQCFECIQRREATFMCNSECSRSI